MSESKTRFSSEFLATVLVVVAAFAAVAFDTWRRSRPLTDSAYVPRETKITPEIELLQEYIRIDTSNPPGREIEAAHWLAGKLAEAGIESEIIESAPGRANLVARLKGKSGSDGLLLTHHMDVTPATAEGWDEPPFAARVRLNQLYGRGALDMKSIGICHLVAFTSLARERDRLQRDVVFLAVADEETGGDLGMAWIVANRPDVLEGVRYSINEGGVAESLRDEIAYFGVEVGSKQHSRLELRSSDRRILERARIALLPMQSPKDPTRVLPEVPPTLNALSTHRTWGRDLLRDVEGTIARGDFWKLHSSYKVLMQNLLRLDGIEDVEGGGARMEVSLELLSDQTAAPVIESVRKIVEPMGVNVRVLREEPPTPISSWSTPLYQVLEDSVHDVYGDVAVGPQIQQYSSNDSRFLRRRGIEAYGLWPFPVTLYQTYGIHKANERVRLDWFMQGVQLTRVLVEKWALGVR